MKRMFFRTGDRVSVHNLGLARIVSKIADDETVIVKGRVICHNRRSRQGLSLIVLCDLPHQECVETFMQDGKRILLRDKCYITHGWEE
jgi:hypothetical protein